MTSDRSSDRAPRDTQRGSGQRGAAAEFAGGRLASATRRRTSSNLTAARLASIRQELTEQGWAVIATVEKFGFALGPQLAHVHFGTAEHQARAARRTLQRLTGLGVLVPVERRMGGARAGSSGVVYRLGLAGLRLLGDTRRILDEPGLHHLQHTLAVVDVFVQLKTAERNGVAEVHTFQGEPNCWRTYLGPHGEPETLKPDAFCDVSLYRSRRLWFVEVDRGTVSTTTLKRKLARYAEYFETGDEQQRWRGVFPRVVWVCNSERRAEHIGRLCERENERFGGELHRLISAEWQPPPDC